MLAEREGFEPPDPGRVNGFQDRRIQPLCHLSKWCAKLIKFKLFCAFMIKYNNMADINKSLAPGSTDR